MMKLFSMIMAMFFALALSTAPAMAESKGSDRYSDSGHKDKKHGDKASKDSGSKDKKKGDDRSKDKRNKDKGDSKSAVNNDKGGHERNAVDTRDVRRDAPAAPNRPVNPVKKPSGWLSY